MTVLLGPRHLKKKNLYRGGDCHPKTNPTFISNKYPLENLNHRTDENDTGFQKQMMCKTYRNGLPPLCSRLWVTMENAAN